MECIISSNNEIIGYKFDNVFGEQIVLENFEFSQVYKELRA